MNRYLAIIIAVMCGAELQAQTLQEAPRLVVNITIDQLRTDYIDQFAPLYGSDGFRKLLQNGCVYDAASYPFMPIDRASAIATIATGTSPYYHGIVGKYWLDRKTLRPVFCVDDPTHYVSPHHLQTSTIGDELKISSNGSAIVWGIAATSESAILSVGHAANGVMYIDNNSGQWRSSTYYNASFPEWLKAYSTLHPVQSPTTSKNSKKSGRTLQYSLSYQNDAVVDASLCAMSNNAMGRDKITDLLAVTLSAAPYHSTVTENHQVEMESIYMSLDKTLARLISGIQAYVGNDQVLFIVTSTGYVDDTVDEDLTQYRIPTGTFYINRTTNLLNMYLSAIYGQGHYVETSFGRQLYFNHKLLEQKRISLTEMLRRSQEFLVQNSGVGDVYTSERLLNGNNDITKLRNGFNPTVSGDIIIDVTPGWNLLNEETKETYNSRATFTPFPIIIYGNAVKSGHINTPVTTDRIAPTIAKAIRIRAPNACSAEPLF